MKITPRQFLVQNRFLAMAIFVTVVAFSSIVFLNVGNVHAQSCGDYIQGGGGTCTDLDPSRQDPAQVAFTANPSSIQSGASSLLSWGSDNSSSYYPYDTCTIDHGVGAFANSGSVSVSPAQTTTYNIFCRHTVQYSTPCGNTNCFTYGYIDSSAATTVSVTQNPSLLVSCSVTPASINTNNSATWAVSASGGTGSYTYAWSGTDGLSGTSASVSKLYTAAGAKSGTVTVTSVGGQSLNTIQPTQDHPGLLGYATDIVAMFLHPVNIAHAMMIACDGGGFAFFIGNGGGCDAGVGGDGPSATTVSCTNTITVNSPLQPDLTPLSLTPHTVVAGQSSVFTATLANTGTAATPNFSSTVYVCATSDAACLGNSLARAQSVWDKLLAYVHAQIAHAATSMKITLTGAAIGAGSTGPQSGSYTFASPGTYQMRLCADLPNNQVTESDENNNCGNWEVLAVCPSGNTIDGSGNCVAPPPPSNPQPTCSLTATPSNSVPSTLTWSSTNATTCTGGGFSAGNATGGSVTAGTPGTYTLSCTGSGGSCSTSADISGGVCTGTPTITIAAAPGRVRVGQTSTISWTATNVPGASPTCTVSGPGVSQSIPAGGTPTCAIPNGSASPTINTQSTYTITCAGISKSVTVNVIPKFIEF
ncbi:MAG: hypothetical protein JWL75_544 [Parcubacteria group bacterium]|nr:hypothetical protein [Parcubacteria group bacterium]